ncbi:hypothetical protein IAI53_06245 [Thauera sp. CAU 1555]|uniref:Uncharacterized protein n=1 Tax=Thauera sedimentorum TaxID=2767595 RepID=A0ABR9B802_9RHOO|nr:hypothetical protein [Thauera sedimentorum]MBC9071560.1 hypothetical protein [Thauera sedimentorum]MBD8502479.1 hypothetical protein [Thauera sedimentorum]
MSRLLPVALVFGAVSAIHAQEVQHDMAQTAPSEASVEAPAEMLIVIPAHDASEMVGDEAAVFPEPLEDARHVEVRRALLNDDELNSGVLERRRLTAEERSAFRLELLRAVRSAYPDDTLR